MVISAIGGYFELELPSCNGDIYPQAIRYQSSRAAFLALLQQSHYINRVFMPYYICDAMLAPVKAAEKELCFYSLDENLAVSSQITLGPSDLLLYVNYFGICAQQCDELLLRFNNAQIVLDCAQAFYAPPRNCYATIYSPRKFFGVPDGGLLVTNAIVTPPKIQDTASQSRISHLIKRLGGDVEEGYEDFKRAESSLNDIEPRGMSNITYRLLHSVNVDAIRLSREINFNYLHQYLNKSNDLTFPEKIEGPHCYPYFPRQKLNKGVFIKNNIFIATYWPDVMSRVRKNSFEAKLVNQCLAIPCDHRYNEKTLSRILDLILK